MPLPPLAEIQIYNDWPDDSHEVTVSVIHRDNTYTNTTAAYRSFDIIDNIEIHVFVKQLTEDRPVMIEDVQKEIFRIIAENSVELKSEGIAVMIPSDFVEITDIDSTTVYWHSMMGVKVIYRKFITF